MTSVHPGPFSFGRAPIRSERRAEATDADYDDPVVVAANLERALRAARARLTLRPRRRR
ncbi:hypothetical protein [Curtobacterium sp. VKM Ac-2922]|uniref:hypothetical protein n=1 Tax=Curtobacterium sp. VKM Ac-2922 TaxID=2929475 RepID=UPI001FB48663|nr:hypothetical protein [Curtobacterium sp. VKM Ac-2922]MCJ1715358.1 hypothetical protein [Curtobacterium sp. VKM Ac-2922]